MIYKDEEEPEDYLCLGYHINIYAVNMMTGQGSFVYLLTKSILIDSRGLFNPVNGLFFEGCWAWEKIADLIPLKYTVH